MLGGDRDRRGDRAVLVDDQHRRRPGEPKLRVPDQVRGADRHRGARETRPDLDRVLASGDLGHHPDRAVRADRRVTHRPETRCGRDIMRRRSGPPDDVAIAISSPSGPFSDAAVMYCQTSVTVCGPVSSTRRPKAVESPSESTCETPPLQAVAPAAARRDSPCGHARCRRSSRCRRCPTRRSRRRRR